MRLAAAALIAVAGLWLLWGVAAPLRGGIIIDDAFISFRYAEHLAAGAGPTWNVGEPPVEGYSSPLWVALLALARWAGLDVMAAAGALTEIATAACLLLAALLVFELTRSRAWALVCVGLVAAHPYVGVWAEGGMEAPLYAALVTGTALAVARESRWAALGLVGLGLVHTEGALWGLAFLAARPRAWKWAALAGVPLALHLLWRHSYYGLWLPLPVLRKVAPWGGLDEVQSFWHRHFVYFAAALSAPRPLALLRFAAVGALLTSLAVANVDTTMAYHGRYWLPVLPLLSALAVAGFASLCTLAPRTMGLGTVMAGLLVGPRLIGALRDVELSDSVMYSRGLKEGHLQLALWLRENTPPDAVVAVGDVGLIGYVSQRPILDLYGLNDAFIATHASGTDVADYVYGRHPDFIVRSAIDNGLPWMDLGEYELVGRWDGHYPMWLFRRR